MQTASFIVYLPPGPSSTRTSLTLIDRNVFYISGKRHALATCRAKHHRSRDYRKVGQNVAFVA